MGVRHAITIHTLGIADNLFNLKTRMDVGDANADPEVITLHLFQIYVILNSAGAIGPVVIASLIALWMWWSKTSNGVSYLTHMINMGASFSVLCYMFLITPLELYMYHPLTTETLFSQPIAQILANVGLLLVIYYYNDADKIASKNGTTPRMFTGRVSMWKCATFLLLYIVIVLLYAVIQILSGVYLYADLVIGVCGTILTLTALIPQLYETWKTDRAANLSIVAIGISIIGLCLITWANYGSGAGLWAVIITALQIPFYVILFFMILIFGYTATLSRVYYTIRYCGREIPEVLNMNSDVETSRSSLELVDEDDNSSVYEMKNMAHISHSSRSL